VSETIAQLERELPGTGAALEARLAAGPDPDGAEARALEVVRTVARADRKRLAGAVRRSPVSLVDVLYGACAVAPFLTRFFLGQPHWLAELCEDDLDAPRTPEVLAAALDAALAGAPAGGEEAALRRLKYRELARIVARDASPARVPEAQSGVVLAELSHLADALLARAFALAEARLEARIGPPLWNDASGAAFRSRFAVLGLGKLGGEELNFSSDVDLVYVWESPGDERGPLEGGPGGLSPEEWAKRLALEFGRMVTEHTADGFLYRIDLDLRPEGERSPIATSSSLLVTYYDAFAAVWEKAAFTKARPVAGDLRFGWRVVRAVHPMIYRSTLDFGSVAAIQDMKARVDREHGAAAGEDFDVKLGAGGIRELEFVAQALQLLHGGRIPQLRGRSTQEALASLAASGVLPGEEAEALLAAYRFLRRLENRLQMEAERQVHRLAAGGPPRERAARALGFTDLAGFEAALASHRARVRQAFERLFGEQGERRVLALFERGAPGLFHIAATRAMLEDLARRFTRELEASADPELALVNLDRFIQGIGARRFYWGLLLDRPELVPRLAALFGASKYLSNLLAAHPTLIEPVFSDPSVFVLSREELRADLAGIRERLEAEAERDPAERALAALRLHHHRQLVNVGLLDLSGKITRREAERALSDVAEVCLEAALDAAREALRRGAAGGPGPEAFLVVGMGKLGSRELSYGSDLDVIFLYDLPGADEAAMVEAQTRGARLAQKLIWALDTRTAEGNCYSVDARLRPSGQQGTLVTSLAALRDHHERSAMVWERQALLRARPAAGDVALGAAFETLRREILARPLPDGLAAEIHRLRMRMEAELAQEGGGHRDLKTGRGGLVDVESVVQYLQLRHGQAYPELHEPESIETQLERLEAHGLVAPAQARVLREGWEFLQRLSSRLRIVQNRSISDLREDRADLDSVARALGYPRSPLTGGTRRPLLEDYRRHTEAIRAVYLDVLGPEPDRLSR
jgi:glutamate-ammonia-ligase adenylyltransferase